jgi:hypothetical protein
MANQRNWMRGIIAGLPDERFRSRKGRLAVVHVEDFTGPEEIMYRVRARPSNEASAALPAVVAR